MHRSSHLQKRKKPPRRTVSSGAVSTPRGAKGIRTPDLLDANEARYQLRHSPLRVIICAQRRLPPSGGPTTTNAYDGLTLAAPQLSVGVLVIFTGAVFTLLEFVSLVRAFTFGKHVPVIDV